MQLELKEIELNLAALNQYKQGIQEYYDTDDENWQRELDATQSLIDKFATEMTKKLFTGGQGND